MSRPAYTPTPADRANVRMMALNGVNQEDIAASLGIAAKTLRKAFSAELSSSTHQLNAKVAGKLFEQCMAGDTTAIIFWLKCKARWNQKSGETDDSTTGSLVEYVKQRMAAPNDPAE